MTRRRGLDAVYDALARMAPASARDLQSREAKDTFSAVCNAARKRGAFALFREASRELLNILFVIVTARAAAVISRRPRASFVGLASDVRLAARSLRAGGSATAIAAATLALGIGVNAAVFSVIDAVLVTNVPFRDHARLVELVNVSTTQKMSFSGMPAPLISEWRRQTDLFDRIEAYSPASLVYESARGSEMVAGASVTPSLFEFVGVLPALGRPLRDADDRRSAQRAVIVSDAFWRKELGGTRALDHASIQLDGDRFAVVGVMPASFRFPNGAAQIWTAASLEQSSAAGARTMSPLARLAVNVSMASADRETRARGSRVSETAGGPAELTAAIVDPGRSVDDRTERSLWLLSGSVAFLFLIVCANVANLTLTRAIAHARQLATCAALGASPMRLARLVVIEHALLAAIATCAGVCIAYGGVRIAVAALPDAITTHSMNAIDLDGRVLLFMAAAGAMSAVLFGLPPAWLAARTSLAAVLGSGGRTSAGSKPAQRLRSVLAIVEVAVCAVLLVGAVMMTRSFMALTSIDRGFDPNGLLSVELGFPKAGYSDARVRTHALEDAAARFAGLPGVSAAAVGPMPNATGMINVGPIEVEASAGATGPRAIVPVYEVPPNYFRTTGMPLISGRAFSADDAPGAVVISRGMAVKYFSGNAIGQRFRVASGPWRLVVGVAADTASREGDRDWSVVIYYPLGQATDALRRTMVASSIAEFRTVLVRTSNPADTALAVRASIGRQDPTIVVWKTERVEHLLAEEIARPRVVFVLLSVFAVFGLVLSMAGLYGVLSCLVAQRRRELGLRLALGASTESVRKQILGNGLMLSGAGLALGIGASLPLARAMRTLVYDAGALDWKTLAGAAGLLLITAIVACWWPARDAMRTDPSKLLRD